MTQPLTLELRSAHFDLQSAKATLVRVPEGPSLEIPWLADELDVVDGRIRDIPYDGFPGRMFAICNDLQTRQHSDGRQFVIPVLSLIRHLTDDDVRAGLVVVDLPERVVVTIRIVGPAGDPRPGVRFSVLTALPESITIEGLTTDDGEFQFLAREGFYSVLLGPERHHEIQIGAADDGERVIVLTDDA